MNRREAYQILGLPEAASVDNIREKYKQLAFQSHPDRNPDNPDAEERFKQVSEAYQFLAPRTNGDTISTKDISTEETAPTSPPRARFGDILRNAAARTRQTRNEPPVDFTDVGNHPPRVRPYDSESDMEFVRKTKRPPTSPLQERLFNIYHGRTFRIRNVASLAGEKSLKEFLFKVFRQQRNILEENFLEFMQMQEQQHGTERVMQAVLYAREHLEWNDSATIRNTTTVIKTLVPLFTKARSLEEMIGIGTCCEILTTTKTPEERKQFIALYDALLLHYGKDMSLMEFSHLTLQTKTFVQRVAAYRPETYDIQEHANLLTSLLNRGKPYAFLENVVQDLVVCCIKYVPLHPYRDWGTRIKQFLDAYAEIQQKVRYDDASMLEIMDALAVMQDERSTYIAIINSIQTVIPALETLASAVAPENAVALPPFVKAVATASRGYVRNSLDAALEEWIYAINTSLVCFQKQEVQFNKAMQAVEELKYVNKSDDPRARASGLQSILVPVQTAAHAGKALVEYALRTPEPQATLNVLQETFRGYRISRDLCSRKRIPEKKMGSSEANEQVYNFLDIVRKQREMGGRTIVRTLFPKDVDYVLQIFGEHAAARYGGKK